MKKVVIVGTGDAARGIALMWDSFAHREETNFEVVAAEPDPDAAAARDDGELMLSASVPIVNFGDAIAAGDVFLLTFPAEFLRLFLSENVGKIKSEAILVDGIISTTQRKRADLAGTLHDLELDDDFSRWAKGFHDVGAITLLSSAIAKTRVPTHIYGPDEEAINQVAEVAEAMGFLPKVTPVDQFQATIRASQEDETIGAEWIHAAAVMVGIFLFAMTYVIIQADGRPRGGIEWRELPTRYASKMFAWTATYGFALSLLPGTLARLLKQLRGKNARIPRVIVWGCSIRKQIGLMALYFVYLHACLMLLIFGDNYFGFMLSRNNPDDDKMDANGEASMLLATLSTSFFTITGIASLPSVQANMNKAQFGCVFGPVVWLGLATGLGHIMVLGVPSWDEHDEPMSYPWARRMPPVTLMASLVPLAVLFVKLVQVVAARTQQLAAFFFKKDRRSESAHGPVEPKEGEQLESAKPAEA